MFKNMRIRNKLLLMVVIPVLGLLFFSTQDAWQRYRVMKQMDASRVLTSIAVKVGAMVHEAQKERGMTAGYLASKGAKFATELPGQREKTTAKVAELKSLLAASSVSYGTLPQVMAAALQETEKITSVRSHVSSQSMSPGDAIAFYSRFIETWLEVVSAIARTADHQEIVRQGTAYLAFLQAKEQCGRERATLNAVFSTDRFDPESFQRAVSVIAAQRTYLSLFTLYATPEASAIFKEKLPQNITEPVTEMERAALEKGTAAQIGIVPETWFVAITNKINAMKEVEDGLARILDGTAGRLATEARRALLAEAAFSALVTMAAFSLGLLIFLSITKPMSSLLNMLQEISEGDGDLTRRLDQERRDEFGDICRRFNLFVDKIGAIITRVAESTVQIASSSASLQSSAIQMATGTEEMAAQATTIATASEEMTATSMEIARSCIGAADSSRQAIELARAGTVVVGETIRGMDQVADRVREAADTVARLGSRSEQIGAIIGTIEDIADQTNLLALNAAIEAARAGEQGRGFAVVADEVRALADRTTKATREISEMIKVIQSETKQAVVSMEQGVGDVASGTDKAAKSGESLEQILQQIEEVTGQVNQIATAAEQQTSTTSEISANIQQITEVAQATALGTHETASSAAELDGLAARLKALVHTFKI